MRAFDLKNIIDGDNRMCCICTHFQDDPEVGRMYGICEHAKDQGLVGPRVVKEAYQECDENR